MIAGSSGVMTVPYTDLAEALQAIDSKLTELV